MDDAIDGGTQGMAILLRLGNMCLDIFWSYMRQGGKFGRFGITDAGLQGGGMIGGKTANIAILDCFLFWFLQ